MLAAKRLQDLAQGYGSRENISVLVVRLMLTPEEQTRVTELMRMQRRGQKELLKVGYYAADVRNLNNYAMYFKKNAFE